MAAYRLTPPQKIPTAKICWKSYRLDFFESRRHPPNRLSSKGPNYQRGVILISTGAMKDIWRIFWREVQQRGLVFARAMPRLTGHLQPKRNWPTGLPLSWSPTLFSGSGPVGLPPVPWTEKTIERSPFLVRRVGHCCRGDQVGRTTFWIFFLSELQKLEQRVKKFIELRGEYVE